MLDPREEYRDRIQRRQATAASLRARDTWIANGRLAIFVAGLAMAWAVFGSPGWPWFVLAAPVAAFGVLMVLHERTLGGIDRAEQGVAYYERGLARLENRWQGGGVSGDELKPQGHLYAEDLDLFGEASLFELLCTARTRAGEETLARWLCEPSDVEEISKRHQAVAELRAKVDFREALCMTGSTVRSGLRPALLRHWASNEPSLPRGIHQIVTWGLTTASVGSALLWALDVTSFRPFVLVLVVVLIHYRYAKDKVLAVLREGEEPLRDLLVFAKVAATIEDETFASPVLVDLQRRLSTGSVTAASAVGRLATLNRWQEAQRNAMFFPLAVALLWSTHFAYAIEAWRTRYGSNVPTWLLTVGEFEALTSLATYAYEQSDDPNPIFVDGPARFVGEDLGHPLLPRNECVRNSVRLDGAPAMLVVSGSNMSGKSTLLRCVGINAVLAQAGAPVRAKSLTLSRLKIGASLHIIDSIQQGTSHFYAEILRLRDVLDETKGTVPVLFLIDEILHGTNSHDRRSGSEAVLKSLVNAGAIGLVTTHDLALTGIVDVLGERAANVHFEDHIDDGKLAFDYTMRSGVVERSNALALMRSIGLDV